MAEELPFLSRWSRRKVEAKQGRERGPAEPGVPASPAPLPAPAVEKAPEPLPPVDSLTPESDFLPFLKPGVDEDLKRQALRTLFRDPQFNVMDGLDIYIGDYSQPDPIPPEMLARLTQMSHLGVREPEPDPAAAREGSVAPAEEGTAAPETAAIAPPAEAVACADAPPPGPVEAMPSSPLPEGVKPPR
jgi:hypothetical protein